MILKIFSMYDDKALAFVRPFFMPNLAMAQRAIVKGSEEKNHPFHEHPNDFILYELGTWDEEHAEFDLSVAPIRHGSVKQLSPVEDKPVVSTVEQLLEDSKNG